jgi:predicted solute-binding protein
MVIHSIALVPCPNDAHQFIDLTEQLKVCQQQVMEARKIEADAKRQLQVKYTLIFSLFIFI